MYSKIVRSKEYAIYHTLSLLEVTPPIQVTVLPEHTFHYIDSDDIVETGFEVKSEIYDGIIVERDDAIQKFIKENLDIGNSFLEALSTIHDAGIYHGDI